MDPRDQALAHLSRLGSTSEALKVLEALKAQRKKEQFIKFWTPTPHQLTAIKSFQQGIKVFGLLGGNRSGKTELGAAIATAWALGKDYFKGEPAWEWVKDLPIPEPPNVIWVVGLDFPTLRDVIWREKLRFGRGHPAMVPKDSLAKPPNDSDFQIFFENGSLITGKSADSGREKFQGASVDLVWIDEEPEVDVYDECYQRTADCAGHILVTLTPLVDTSSGVKTPWVFDLFEESRAGATDIKFEKLSVIDNPYVPREEIAKLLDKWAGHPEEKARLYGDFIQRSGLVYNLWDAKKHVIDPEPLSEDWPRWVSIDPAATGTTAVLWAAIKPNDDIVIYKEYYEKNLVVSDHVKNILVRNSGDKVNVWLLDPKWASQRNAETHKTGLQLYRDSGLPVRAADVGEDYGLNVSREYIAAAIDPAAKHPKVQIFRDCSNLIWEIEHYVWAFFGKGELKGLSKDKPLKRNDHAVNAMQYLMAMRPKGRRNSTWASESDKRAAVALNSYT